MRSASIFFIATAAASLGAADSRGAPTETAAAREQARLCERLAGASGAAACQQALALGIALPRRAAVREQLARHLVALEDWDALAELFRESATLAPQDALAWRRLGLTLLFALHQPSEALGALEQAVRLAPADAEARAGLAQALAASGQLQAAVAAFDEALKLDAAVLDGRPAARAALDAARRGAPWP
ncbi:MAG TPA: tetratricopeptide repeat protein [Vicinamibacteria bacterium]